MDNRKDDRYLREGHSGRGMLLGHAGPDPQAARSDLDAESATPVREVPNATYRNHGNHAEAIEIIFDPAQTDYRGSSSSSSRSTTRPPRTGRATTSAPATARRSSTPVTTRRRSPRTRSPTSRPPVCGPERWSPRSARPGTSGRPSPSIRTTWSITRTATPATSCGQGGSFRGGRTSRASSRVGRRRYGPDRAQLIQPEGGGDGLPVGIGDRRLECEVGLAAFGRLGFDPGDRVVVEAGLCPQLASAPSRRTRYRGF